jgi:hypothetical protein
MGRNGNGREPATGTTSAARTRWSRRSRRPRGLHRHPQHAGLVERRRDAQVVDFPEIDTVAIEP